MRPLSLLALLVTAAACAGCGSASPATPQATLSADARPAAVLVARRTTSDSAVDSGPSKPSVPAPVAIAPLIVPHILWDPIPFGPLRKSQMLAYVHRHYGSFMRPTYKLLDPHVIVIHYTVTPTFQATYNTFASDQPDPELHELPNTCAHFVVDRSGIIHQLVPLDIMCRHTVGLNWTAIGIEHVGYSDREILGNRRQMASSLRLVRWLRCRFHIAVANIIGHNESLSSPYHREDVPSLRAQTHDDFKRADMQIYRGRLRAAGACPTA